MLTVIRKINYHPSKMLILSERKCILLSWYLKLLTQKWEKRNRLDYFFLPTQMQPPRQMQPRPCVYVYESYPTSKVQ